MQTILNEIKMVFVLLKTFFFRNYSRNSYKLEQTYFMFQFLIQAIYFLTTQQHHQNLPHLIHNNQTSNSLHFTAVRRTIPHLNKSSFIRT